MPGEWLGFYSTSQVSRLARVPLRTLYDWKSRGIIRPSVQLMDNDLVALDGYSYADLTIIKILRALREDQINLSSAGVALRHLWERLGPPSRGWADAHVYLVGKRIYAEKQDKWETTAATQFGQKVETRLFGDLFQELKGQEEEGSILVPKDFRTFVDINPKVMGGQPVVRGTRVPTSILATLKAKGKSIKELVSLYSPIPMLTIKKAIAYEDFLDKAIA
jgi:uncharacterized protein (DUF433 family)/DNA-binding transcriptional MerR regulator